MAKGTSCGPTDAKGTRVQGGGRVARPPGGGWSRRGPGLAATWRLRAGSPRPQPGSRGLSQEPPRPPGRVHGRGELGNLRPRPGQGWGALGGGAQADGGSWRPRQPRLLGDIFSLPHRLASPRLACRLSANHTTPLPVASGHVAVARGAPASHFFPPKNSPGAPEATDPPNHKRRRRGARCHVGRVTNRAGALGPLAVIGRRSGPPPLSRPHRTWRHAPHADGRARARSGCDVPLSQAGGRAGGAARLGGEDGGAAGAGRGRAADGAGAAARRAARGGGAAPAGPAAAAPGPQPADGAGHRRGGAGHLWLHLLQDLPGAIPGRAGAGGRGCPGPGCQDPGEL
ncbi:unnamed protein product, partial [Natator depressus]